MLLRMDHIDLVVKDVEETKAFLEKLGFGVVRRLDHHGVAYEMQLPGENQVIFEIHGSDNPNEVGLRHLAFLVDDCDTTLAELKDTGIAFTSEWKHVQATGRMVANFSDPSGIRMQLTK